MVEKHQCFNFFSVTIDKEVFSFNRCISCRRSKRLLSYLYFRLHHSFLTRLELSPHFATTIISSSPLFVSLVSIQSDCRCQMKNHYLFDPIQPCAIVKVLFRDLAKSHCNFLIQIYISWQLKVFVFHPRENYCSNLSVLLFSIK